jgi:hypothetical protein
MHGEIEVRRMQRNEEHAITPGCKRTLTGGAAAATLKCPVGWR